MNQITTKRWILLVTLLVFLVGCKPEAVDKEDETTPIAERSGVPTQTTVRTGVTILADGVVQTVQPALPLAFKTAGKLQALHVCPGDRVQEGDLLAELDETEAVDSYQAAVTTAELAVLRAEQALDDLYANTELARTDALNEITTYAQAVRDAQFALENFTLPTYLQGLELIEALDRMKAQLDSASAAFEPYRYLNVDDETRKDRLETLNDAQSQYDAAVKHLKYAYELQVAQANLDKARADYDKYTAGPAPDDLALAEAELANAQAQLALAESDLEEAIEDQEDIFLLAPWDGTVLSIETAPGALVGSSTPILTLLDTTQLEFHTTNLSERDLAQIKPGQTAFVTLKAYPDAPIEASVLRIGWQAGEAVGDAATFPVILGLNETNLDIRPGMTGRVEIRRDE